MKDPDYILLSLGIIRSIVWMFGCLHGIHHKRILQTSVCALALYNSTIFALLNAHVHVYSPLVNVAVGSGVPLAVGVVGVIILNTVVPSDKSKWEW